MSELVFIRAYRTRFEAEQAQQYLAGQGIDAMVQADDAGGMYAGLSLGKKGVRLVVREADADRAREALEPGEMVDPAEAADPGAGPDAAPSPPAAAETAARHFDRGHNCAEAVLRTFADDVDAGEIVRLATGFGGGMGRDGDACGALAGGVMALGLWLGRLEPEDDASKERCYEGVRELRRRFAEACGDVDCRDLTGVDLTSEAGRQRYDDEEMDAEVCRRCVREAAGFVAEIVGRLEREEG